MNFKLKTDFKPAGDQPQAIDSLTLGIKKRLSEQVLLGVTGSGKTFTLANVIARLNLPTLVISHNKTLAGQLYQEFRDFFPSNAVSYFVSYYDYYLPESYIPQTDTYIEKETEINEEIDKLRLAATTNLLTRKDTLVVASVSSIYNIGSPREYGKFVLELKCGMKIEREQILLRLVDLQYQRAEYEFTRGTFRIRGEAIDLYPAYEDRAIRILTKDNFIDKMYYFEPIGMDPSLNEELRTTVIYPSKHYMTDPKSYERVFKQIKKDLKLEVANFKKRNKPLEAYRLNQRVNYDLEMIKELGYVNGIENYSRYFDGRLPGDPPYSLFDYYKEAYGSNWLLIIDESHMTIPQLHGMYNGDQARKQTLIDFGFRLKAALDNRPLKFEEFISRKPQTIYVSATPDEWELEKANQIVEQLVRPTGLLDPEISLKSSKDQVLDLTVEIKKRAKRKERTLVTTLTKKTAEDLAKYLEEHSDGLSVMYLHSDIETLKRQDILEELRRGKYDVLVGINLLREGLDLPEVSLVAILDADKEGFLRSETSLIQTMGRAARHKFGAVIMYADKMTNSMKKAIFEVARRRNIQLEYNRKNNITPQTITKPIRKGLVEKKPVQEKQELIDVQPDSLTPKEKIKYLKDLTAKMKEAAKDLDFELAASYRDKINSLEFSK